MTEAQWLACTRPPAMLDFLRRSGRASDRRLRLFAAACCRRVWRLLRPGPEHQLVDLVEALADGAVGVPEVEGFARRVEQASTQVQYERRQAVTAAVYAAEGDYGGTLNHAAVAAAYDLTRVKPPYDESTQAPWRQAVRGEQAGQVMCFHDLFGNPLPLTLAASLGFTQIVPEPDRQVLVAGQVQNDSGPKEEHDHQDADSRPVNWFTTSVATSGSMSGPMGYGQMW